MDPMRWRCSVLLILLCSLLVKGGEPLSSKYAFATVVRNDDEVLLARVLMHTIKKDGYSQHPLRRYIFAHPGVSQTARTQILQDEDVILRALPDSKFTYTALFNVTEVDRMLYMTPATLVVDDLTKLFECGKFCAAFTTPCSFHTGVMVLSPNELTFKNVTKTYEDLIVDSAECGVANRPDGLNAEDCVLNEMYGLTLYDAPLFHIGEEKSYGGELKRLPFGCHVNHVLYYPRLRWEIPEQTCGKRRVVDFMGPSYMKPDKWWTYALLDLGDTWLASRQQLDDPTAPWSYSIGKICWRLTLSISAVIGLLVAFTLSNRPRYPQGDYVESNPFPKRDERLYILVAVSLILIGWLLSLLIGLWATPADLMPVWGALMFSTYKWCFFVAWTLVIGFTFCASQASGDEISKPRFGATLQRAVFETMLLGFFDVAFPLIGVLYVRNYVLASIYMRLMALLPVLTIYFLMTITLAGRLSVVWLLYGAGHMRYSPLKVR